MIRMNWFYAIQNEQRGPVSEAEVGELQRTGVIQPATLVWREGLAQWQTFASLQPPPPLNGLVCAQCGRVFAPEEIVQFGDAAVCAGCKPLFLQRLREGVVLAAPGALRYAGFWVRFGAIFVDGIIGWSVSIGISLACGQSFLEATGFDNNPEMTQLDWLLTAVSLSIGAAYEIIFVLKFGATPGKMAFRLKVVTAEGGLVSVGQAVGRYFAAALSWLTCGIGFIIAAFDGQKRALHDRICGTRVIKIRKD